MEETRNVTFRLATDLVDRLDRYAEFLQRSNPGIKVKRVDALRNLLVTGLDSAESKQGYRQEDRPEKTQAHSRKPKSTK